MSKQPKLTEPVKTMVDKDTQIRIEKVAAWHGSSIAAALRHLILRGLRAMETEE